MEASLITFFDLPLLSALFFSRNKKVGRSYEAMEERFKRVGWRAKQIGGELSAAEQQRLRVCGTLSSLFHYLTYIFSLFLLLSFYQFTCY